MISLRRSALAATSGRMVLSRLGPVTRSQTGGKRKRDDDEHGDEHEDCIITPVADQDKVARRPRRGVCCMCCRTLSSGSLSVVAVWTWKKNILISHAIFAANVDVSVFAGTAPADDVAFRQGDKLCKRCATFSPAFLEKNNVRCWGPGPVGKACDGQVKRSSTGRRIMYQGRSYCDDCYRAVGKCGVCTKVIGPKSARFISKDKSLCWQYICHSCYNKERDSFTCAKCDRSQPQGTYRYRSKLDTLRGRHICINCYSKERDSFTCAKCDRSQPQGSKRYRSKLDSFRGKYICQRCHRQGRV